MEKNRALFLDRDGIFNELVPRNGILTAPWSWSEWKPIPEMTRQGLDAIRALGFRLILVTNQPDVERGDTSLDFVEAVHKKCREDFGLDAVYACVNGDDAHPWKKPNPGMLLRAAEDFSLSLSECFLLGDTGKDVGAARRAGCRSILWNRHYNEDVTADFRVSSLAEVLELLRR